MQIQKFSFQNFRGYGNEEHIIELDGNSSLRLLQGLNGSGKSSILMSLNFVIYGNITTLKNELLANFENKHCIVKAEIKISDNEYLHIKRGLSPNKLDCKFQVGGKDITASFGKRELQSIINDRFQIPQNIFNNLICINISDYSSFFEISASERKSRVDKIFNLTELNKYLEITKDILKTKKLELNDFHVKINLLEKQINSKEDEVEEIRLQEKKQRSINKEEIEKEKQEINKKIDELNNKIEKSKKDEEKQIIANNKKIEKDKETIQIKINDCEKEIIKLKDIEKEQIIKNNQIINSKKEVIDVKITELNELITELNNELELLNTELNDLKSNYKELDEKNEKGSKLIYKYEKKIDEIKFLEKEYYKFNNINKEEIDFIEYEDDYEDFIEEHKNEIERLQKEIENIEKEDNDLDIKTRDLEREIKLIKSKKCPTCGTDLTSKEFILKLANYDKENKDIFILKEENQKKIRVNSEDIKDNVIYMLSRYKGVKKYYSDKIEEIKEKLKKIANKRNRIIEEQKEIEEKQFSIKNRINEKEREINRLKYNIKELEFKIDAKIDEFEEEIKKQEKEINKLKYNIKELELKINAKIDEFEEERKQYEKEINDYKYEIKGLDYKLKETDIEYKVKIKQIEKQIEDSKNDIKRIKSEILEQEEEIEIFEILQNALGENGLKRDIFQSIIPIINEQIKVFSKIVDNEFICELDTDFGFNITNKGIERDIKTLSTGQKKKLEMVLIFSFLAILKSQWDNINVLFLDEVFSGLDVENSNNIISVLDVVRKQFNLHIFCSHHQDLDTTVFTHIYNIYKDEYNFSQIELKQN